MKRILNVEIVISLLFPAVSIFLNERESHSWLTIRIILMLSLTIKVALAILSIYFLLTRPKLHLRQDNNQNTNSARQVDYNRTWKAIVHIATIQIVYILCNLPLGVFFIIFIDGDDKNAVPTNEQAAGTEIILFWLLRVSETYNGINACLYYGTM